MQRNVEQLTKGMYIFNVFPAFLSLFFVESSITARVGQARPGTARVDFFGGASTGPYSLRSSQGSLSTHAEPEVGGLSKIAI